MELEEAKWLMRERIKVDRQMRDGDINSDYSKWAEEQSQAMELVLEELERRETNGTDKNIQKVEKGNTTE